MPWPGNAVAVKRARENNSKSSFRRECDARKSTTRLRHRNLVSQVDLECLRRVTIPGIVSRQFPVGRLSSRVRLGLIKPHVSKYRSVEWVKATGGRCHPRAPVMIRRRLRASFLYLHAENYMDCVTDSWGLSLPFLHSLSLSLSPSLYSGAAPAYATPDLIFPAALLTFIRRTR
jgi:hypothetical protein